jgi:hypothetical protein
MSGKNNIFESILRLLPIVGSESFVNPHDRDGIYYLKMVLHVQICQLVD